MKVGIDLLLWTAHVTEEQFPVMQMLKEVGYDGVEIPVFGGDVAHFEKVGKAIKDNGLGCTSVTIIPDQEHSPVSPDAKNRQRALDHLKWAIDCSAALGSSVLGGPFFAPLGVFTGQGPTEEEKKRAADVHRKAADHAQSAPRSVALAVEFLNRFECYFLNTLADAAQYAQRVDRPNFGVLFDTFHANIEEKDPVGCISKHIDVIKHVHTSENDRGTPGKGHVNWSGTFKALRSGGYDDWLTIEAFGRSLPDLAATTCVWRDLSASQQEVYTFGLKFIKDQWQKAGKEIG
jgi:D-psicose/D-tagatose/L-ribulose 3-epimerase